MPPVKHIEYVYNKTRNTHSTYQEYVNFLNILEMVMKYEHSNIPIENNDIEKKKIFKLLYKKLSTKFFDLLYVERPEKDDIVRFTDTKWLTIVTGQVGAGKTTLLLKVEKELRSQDNCFVFFVDLPKKFAVLDGYDLHAKDAGAEYSADANGVGGIGDTVCHVIVDHIRSQIRKDYDKNFDKKYGIFKVLNHPGYTNLINSIRESYISAPDGSEKFIQEVIKTLDIDYIKEKKVIIDQTVFDGAIDLEIILSGIKEHHPSAKIVLVIDNIDRYSTNLHRQLFDKSLAFARTGVASIILALRPYNLRVLRNEGNYGDVYHVVDGLKMQLPSDVNLVPTRQLINFIRQFIQKRLDFIVEQGVDIIRREKFGELHGKPLNIQYSDFMVKFWNLFRLAIEGKEDSPIFGNYLRWCNNSLRNVAIHITKFISSVVLGEDEQYCLNKLVNLDDKIKIQRRKLKSYVFKRMICNDNLSYDGKTCLNAFSNMNTCSDMEGIRVYFLEHKILSYLQNANHNAKYGEIINDFGKLGVPKDKLFRSIQKLRRARSKDELGYLFVDRRESDINVDMPDETLILLLPAGEFFVQVLSISCEYLFWCALDCELSERLKTFKYVHSIDLNAVQEDESKVKIAVDFVENILLKMFIDEIIAMKNLKKLFKDHAAFNNLVGKFEIDDTHWCRQMLISLDKFASIIPGRANIQKRIIAAEESLNKAIS